MKALIVDDVLASCNILKLLVKKYCQEITEVKTTTSAKEAIAILNEEPIDLLFMDIEMPEMNGFDLIRSIKSPDFELVFVSAFDSYAIKAFRFGAIDYLLKPVSIEELKACVTRVLSRRTKEDKPKRLGEIASYVQAIYNEEIISIGSKKSIDLVNINELVRLESDGSYTNCVLVNDKPIYSSKNMKEFEKSLEAKGFLRIHHQHLVNLRHIKKYSRVRGGEIILSNGEAIPVSQRKKDRLLEVLKMLG